MENVTRFLVYCIEIYKTAHRLSGKQIMHLFNQYGIQDYIVNCYGALHTTGPEYIIEEISGVIKERDCQSLRKCDISPTFEPENV